MDLEVYVSVETVGFTHVSPTTTTNNTDETTNDNMETILIASWVFVCLFLFIDFLLVLGLNISDYM